MTARRHVPGEDCPLCMAEVARREDEREHGRPEGTTDRELDAMADAAAADMVYKEPS